MKPIIEWCILIVCAVLLLIGFVAICFNKTDFGAPAMLYGGIISGLLMTYSPDEYGGYHD